MEHLFLSRFQYYFTEQKTQILINSSLHIPRKPFNQNRTFENHESHLSFSWQQSLRRRCLPHTLSLLVSETE